MSLDFEQFFNCHMHLYDSYYTAKYLHNSCRTLQLVWHFGTLLLFWIIFPHQADATRFWGFQFFVHYSRDTFFLWKTWISVYQLMCWADFLQWSLKCGYQKLILCRDNNKFIVQKLHQSNEIVNFIGNLIIISYLKHLFLHHNHAKKLFIWVHIGQHICWYKISVIGQYIDQLSPMVDTQS